MEEEKYLKCTGCNSVGGVFIKDNQDMNIFCGDCNLISLFVEITKEEFDIIISNN